MNEASNLIRAISDLLWPLIVLAVLVVYKAQVVGALSRLRRFSFPGGSAEFDIEKDLDRLETSATAADEALPLSTPTAVQVDAASEHGSANSTVTAGPEAEVPVKSEGYVWETANAVFSEAANSPKLALITLAGDREASAADPGELARPEQLGARVARAVPESA